MGHGCLLVCADSAMRMKLSAALRREGFEVLAAKSALEAAMLFAQRPVSAVLCDLHGLQTDPTGTLQTLRGRMPGLAPLVLTLGDAPVDGSGAVHIPRATPPVYVAALLSNALNRRAPADTHHASA